MRRIITTRTRALAMVIISALAFWSIVTVAASAQPPQLTDNNGGNSLCFNRSGNGTSIGTHVIAYNCGYQNNDFSFIALGTMCGSGYVTDTCPFIVGSGLNLSYKGFQIVAVESPSTGLCVGGANAGDTKASLQTCPQPDGTGGGFSTVDVIVPGPLNGGHLYEVIVNRNWSDWDVTHSNPQCNGFGCTLNLGAFNGYQMQISLNVGDQQVRAGNPGGATYYDVWTEI